MPTRKGPESQDMYEAIVCLPHFVEFLAAAKRIRDITESKLEQERTPNMSISDARKSIDNLLDTDKEIIDAINVMEDLKVKYNVRMSMEQFEALYAVAEFYEGQEWLRNLSDSMMMEDGVW